MIVTESLKGRLEPGKREKQTEYVDFEWDEAFKRLHRKQTREGTQIGIRLGDEILKRGLRDGDILYEDEERVIAVNILPCSMLAVYTDNGHIRQLAKACYEIGNTHAPLFEGPGTAAGEEMPVLLTIYSEPLERLLGGLHGVHTQRVECKPDFDRRISGAAHSHSH